MLAATPESKSAPLAEHREVSGAEVSPAGEKSSAIELRFDGGSDPQVLFTAALLKVASRCNLDCDYCYVYQHSDQSWRSQPRFMTTDTIERFAQRLQEYLALHDLPEFSITFHGGEPLLFGGERLVRAARTIRDIAGSGRSLSFSLQSNGTLLTDDVISLLESAEIDVSVSLDGPQELHDRHRPDHGGNSTFSDTLEAIHRLQQRKSRIFTGVIAVIDPLMSPRQLFDFFAPLDLPRLDLLLPDSTHERPPAGRANNPQLYVGWLREAFKLWFREFSQLPVRWFDALLAARVGVPSPTDAMGLGSVNLIVIDTDGSYTDHDVFKITSNGRAALGWTLWQKSFEEVSRHASIQEHCFRLTIPGLAAECQTCPVVDACGGGSVMHRWHPTLGLNAPSVYCPELFGVLETATEVLRESLALDSANHPRKIVPVRSGEEFVAECIRWRTETEDRGDKAAERLKLLRGPNDSAAAMLLSEQFEASQPIARPGDDQEACWLGSVRVHSCDARLVTPFLQSIRVLPRKSPQVNHGIAMLGEAMALLSQLDSKLPAAFEAMISDVVFVESTIESRDQIFSFSDDTSPNVLYIAPYVGTTPLGSDDFGDSLFHEFLHHVLYHMERDEPMLHDHVYPRFPAPWRNGLRPAGGFFHGTFVFTGLAQYWAAMARSALPGISTDKAQENAERFTKQAEYGIKSLRQFAILTKRGQVMLDLLTAELGLDDRPMLAPVLQPLAS